MLERKLKMILMKYKKNKNLQKPKKKGFIITLLQMLLIKKKNISITIMMI